MLDQLTDLANGVNGSEGEVTVSAPMVNFIRKIASEKGVSLRARRIAGVTYVKGNDLVMFVNDIHGHEKIKAPAESLPSVEELDLSGRPEDAPPIEPDGDLIINETANRTRILRSAKGSPGLHNVNPPPNEVADLSEKGSLDVVQADERLAEDRDPREFESRQDQFRNRRPFPTVSGVPPTGASPAEQRIAGGAMPTSPRPAASARSGSAPGETVVDPDSAAAANVQKPDPNNPPPIRDENDIKTPHAQRTGSTKK